jgi:integrase
MSQRSDDIYDEQREKEDVERQRGSKRVRLHDLRHSHATHMLAAGVHPKVASDKQAEKTPA